MAGCFVNIIDHGDTFLGRGYIQSTVISQTNVKMAICSQLSIAKESVKMAIYSQL